MSNVVKFTKTKKGIPAKAILDVTHRYVEHRHRRVQFLPWNMVLNIMILLIGCLRTIALTLLLWFRPILFVVIRPLSGLLLIGCLRTIALTLLLWFRPILFVVIRPLSGLLLIAFIICLFTHPAEQRLTLGFGLLSFAAFLIMYLYDGVLMFLSRGNMVNILN